MSSDEEGADGFISHSYSWECERQFGQKIFGDMSCQEYEKSV